MIPWCQILSPFENYLVCLKQKGKESAYLFSLSSLIIYNGGIYTRWRPPQ